jgi:hypothetical protein
MLCFIHTKSFQSQCTKSTRLSGAKMPFEPEQKPCKKIENICPCDSVERCCQSVPGYLSHTDTHMCRKRDSPSLPWFVKTTSCSSPLRSKPPSQIWRQSPVSRVHPVKDFPGRFSASGSATCGAERQRNCGYCRQNATAR